ncbi:hypothetical protein HID58_058655 [Brassica napus]|uniref:Uncharacterized protein n=1 Tax=Brassica napus TaxID=3708 RepID=A0ABQ7ZQP9_BRANA|nr:hypothetical protein HID58_058655 [Brassica napus]
MAAGSKKRLRNIPTYGTTFLGSTTASAPDFVPDSQSHERSPQTTQHLKAYWNLPRSDRMFNNSSVARLTPDADGNLPLVHTSGQIPHARVALKIVTATEKGEAPPAFRWDICGCSSRKDSQRCGDSDPKGPDPVVMTKSGWCTGLVVHRRTRQILLNK